MNALFENDVRRRPRRPAGLVEGFDAAWLVGQDLAREEWQYLWRHFGLLGLLDLARRSGWLEVGDDTAAAGELVERSLAAGYDPVSGLIGEVNSVSGAFEPELN